MFTLTNFKRNSLKTNFKHNAKFENHDSVQPYLTNCFQVKQPHVPATDITYLVTEPPRYGYLELEGLVGGEEGEEAVTTFTQETVNSGRLHYVQATANQTRDRMVVDVTNGITWLRDLVVIILPLSDIACLFLFYLDFDRQGIYLTRKIQINEPIR